MKVAKNARAYHLGLCKPNTLGGSTRSDTLVLQVRQCVDFLSCEIWLYLGHRMNTKKNLRAVRADILKSVNSEHGTSYKRVVID